VDADFAPRNCTHPFQKLARFGTANTRAEATAPRFVPKPPHEGMTPCRAHGVALVELR
jgi:hypothetical protein